jgi:hypothetical protein
MNYTTLDGTILESSSISPVIYTQPVIDYNDDIYVSYETGHGDGFIQQIKVVREVINGIMTITITEQTQEEIDAYMKQIEKEQLEAQSQNNTLNINNN